MPGWRSCSGAATPIWAAGRKHFQQKMSLYAAHIRDPKAMEELAGELEGAFRGFFGENGARSPLDLPFAFKNRDMLLVQRAMLSAMALTGKACLSRGAALLADPSGKAAEMPGMKAGEELEAYRYLPGNGSHREDWIRTAWDGGAVCFRFPGHPAPAQDRRLV